MSTPMVEVQGTLQAGGRLVLDSKPELPLGLRAAARLAAAQIAG